MLQSSRQFKGKIATKSLSLDIKHHEKKIKHGTTQKVCHLIMGFFTPFNFVIVCQFYSNTSLVLFTMLDFIKELLNV